MNKVDSDRSAEDQDAADSPADKRLDDQLRHLYEYVLDEPIPKRLLDALKQDPEDKGPTEDEDKDPSEDGDT